MPESSDGLFGAWSPLAWELAHHCTFTGGPEGTHPVRAELPTFTLLHRVEAWGDTMTEAKQNLARQLDRIAEDSHA